MPRNWSRCNLGDAIVLQRGFDLPRQEREPGKIPIVSSSGISGVHSKAKVAAPGVVTGRYGTIGQVFYVEEDFWPLNTTLYVKDFKGNDPHFISYLLQTIDFQSCSDKSSVPGVNRNDLHRIIVDIPGLSAQQAIAHILGTLDDKIDLNQRMTGDTGGNGPRPVQVLVCGLRPRPRQSRRPPDLRNGRRHRRPLSRFLPGFPNGEDSEGLEGG